MRSNFLLLGSVSALTGVALGALGAHGLKGVLHADLLAAYQTAVSYQMWHALGLIGIDRVHQQNPGSRLIHYSGWLMFLGILLFSGSLYLMALLDLKWFGVITPFGGLSFLIAWLSIAVFSIRNQPSSRYS